MRLEILPVALYVIVAAVQWYGWRQPVGLLSRKAMCLLVGFIAVTLHALLLYRWIDIGAGQNLTFFNMCSLVTWLVALLVLLTSLRRPAENLVVFIFPVAAISIVLVGAFPGQYYIVDTAADPSMLLHILSSTLAFSVLCVAGLQAVLLAIQESRLRHRHGGGIIEVLPPLETMEILLFQMLRVGFLLLSIVLVSSVYFFSHEIVTSAIIRKLVLTVLAWLVFVILLIGHRCYGWRGKRAVQGTLSGVLLLVVVYFSGELLVGLWS